MQNIYYLYPHDIFLIPGLPNWVLKEKKKGLQVQELLGVLIHLCDFVHIFIITDFFLGYYFSSAFNIDMNLVNKMIKLP